jgi:putative endonuclease
MEMKWFVYILSNHTNTVLYVGVTNNLDRRIWEHKTGLDPNSFTSRYRVYKLLWFERFDNPTEAIAAEKKIKKWRREKKFTLIRTLNPGMKDLMALR